MANLEHTLPSVVDGLKPAQRKVLFCSFKRNLVKETKVSHLAGYVAEHSAYHHGEQSLANTIIGMAQDFVGTNNISLLEPRGLFGTRYSVGIGPGSKNYIPSYNPRDVIANLKRLLNEGTVIQMDPWYKGFKGSVKNARAKAAGVTYTITGVIEEVDGTKLKITELPIRSWTVDYKEFLESMCPQSEQENGNEKNKGKGKVKVKEPPFLVKIRSQCDHANVEFEVIMILKEFFQLRLEFYARRKAIMLQNIGNEILKLKNKVRFILAVISEDIIVNNRKTAELYLELKQKGYEPFPENLFTSEPVPAGSTEEVDEENEENPVEGAAGVTASDYEYLLAVAIFTFTEEKAQELITQMNKLEAESESLGKATAEILWLGELDALEKELDVLDGNSEVLEEETTRRPGKNSKGEKAYNPDLSREHSGCPAAEKPKTAIRKRAPARSKDIFKPTGDSNSSAPSPEKKVRKLRISLFNKKSGSVSQRVASTSTGVEDAEAPPSGSLAQPVTLRRTAREGKAKAICIDSESDDSV
ncbi:DNA topoisomerase 2-like [Triticum dicoccoides]|uniref:DNA topoisomerase 2-like n=1 Tax=Triticum dicoccoides TaxID=85692 RepID=UPI00188F897B|nr:DNA topoisomerase 2-like [Triticum dicoccoides]